MNPRLGGGGVAGAGVDCWILFLTSAFPGPHMVLKGLGGVLRGPEREEADIRRTLGGVHVVAQQVKNQTSIHEGAGSIPSSTQWVKDPVLLQAAVQFTDAARIWCGCGCGCGQQLQL